MPADASHRLMDCRVSPGQLAQQAADPDFARSVLDGLSATPKALSSRYFYDEHGDRLFQRIMASPDYYLTDCEQAIFEAQADTIAQAMLADGPCEIIELGSGDGRKVALLLDALHRQSSSWTFRPVDISAHSLELLADNLLPGRPWLKLDPINDNYMTLLDGLQPGPIRRVFMFLGSNLGNFGVEGSIDFLRRIRAAMSINDALLIGLDLKKDPAVVRAAYDDAAGLTRDFNLNLLARINRELDGNFDLGAFEHQPRYDPDSGAAESYLVSRKDQVVYIGALNRSFEFARGEAVFTEISQKYDEGLVASLCATAGFRPELALHDPLGWFTDQVWRPVLAGGNNEGKQTT